MKGQFIEVFRKYITRPGSDKLLEWLEDSDFFTAPASTRYHLNHEGGLCEHSLNVYYRLRKLYIGEQTRRTGEEVAFLSPDEEEKIAICGLLHDLCKIHTYRPCIRNQKTYDKDKVAAAYYKSVKHDAMGDFIWETVPGYEHDEEFIYGHGEKSVLVAMSYMKLTPEEASAIRWHMGSWQDGEKNNAGKAFSKYPLAVLTHIADMMATYLDEGTC